MKSDDETLTSMIKLDKLFAYQYVVNSRSHISQLFVKNKHSCIYTIFRHFRVDISILIDIKHVFILISFIIDIIIQSF